MKKLLKISAIIFSVLVLVFSVFIGWTLYPHERQQELLLPLIAASSEEGLQRLENAQARSDYESLKDAYQAQSLVSYCGVATSVSVLKALGIHTTQGDFFTAAASQVRSQIDVVTGGMSLGELAGLLKAHGVQAELHHIDQLDLTAFRKTVEENLSQENDFLIVNYQREVLGQGKVGHISPLSAYDRGSDSVLIMDTAAHKYPPTWVPLDMLFAAMNTLDSASGKLRGFVEVSKE